MRRIITGAGPDGRSRVESVEEFAYGSYAELGRFPAVLGDRTASAGRSDILDLQVAPGEARWIVVPLPASYETAMHRTHTVDFDTLVSGTVTLVLGDGSIDMRVGDCVVVSGVDHAWRTGEAPATLLVAAIGTRPAAGEPTARPVTDFHTRTAGSG
jgi:mannose-6-phosphate isomerase-like protein (cupin superfamily)